MPRSPHVPENRAPDSRVCACTADEAGLLGSLGGRGAALARADPSDSQAQCAGFAGSCGGTGCAIHFHAACVPSSLGTRVRTMVCLVGMVGLLPLPRANCQIPSLCDSA